QSIFEFAGKKSDYLANLKEDDTFQNLPLLKNYRCHPSITNYSLALMDKNVQLIETNSIRVLQKNIEGNEHDIGKWIDRQVMKIHNTPLSKIAILTKSSKTAKIIYDVISSPCKIIVNSSLENSSHLVATLFDKVIKFAYNKQITITEIIEDFIFFDSLKEIEKKELKRNFENIRDGLTLNNFEINQIKILFGQIAKILIPNVNQDGSLNLLEKVLSEELEIYSKVSEDEVQIMTLHKSKGLEFDIVFHLDLYKYILPKYKGNYQQDLNLHYVGVTRAKKACILCTSIKRTNSKNEIITASVSEFLTLNNVDSLRSII
ncbi:MAG TPA: ATP-dependent helicase, partial [Saprospiraceae bacterium]|nr:ATP-dependent helicase [Saprospiraceae bacterium]